MSIASIKSIASIVLQVCPGSLVAACVSIANLQTQGKEKRRCRGAIQSAARGQMTSKTRAKRFGVRRGIAAFNAPRDVQQTDPRLLRRVQHHGHLYEDYCGRPSTDELPYEEMQQSQAWRPYLLQRVVLNDMKKVGSGHLEYITMKVFLLERRARLCDSRFQERDFPDAGFAAVPRYLVVVYFQNVVNG